jgi:hypothetical protein
MKGAIPILFACAIGLMLASPAQAQRGRGRMYIPPAKNSTYKTAPAGEVIGKAKEAKLDKLAEDLKALTPDSAPSAEQRKTIEDDVKDLADGAAKSCSTEIRKVVADLLASYPKARAKLSDDQVHQLATHLKDLVSPIGQTREQIDGVAAKARGLLVDAGVGAAEADRFAKDAKALITEERTHMPQR